MIQQLGDFAAGATLRFMWNTNGQDGASITRGTNGTIRIYKNNSTTERTSSAGITDTEDFDTLTGVHQCSIDLSDNTDAGFYATGNDYFVVLQGAVIDTKTVNVCLAQFSIANRIVSTLATAANLSTLTGYVDTEVAAIKAKTDSLTFTVAGQVDANIKSVNDITVTGSGTVGTPWGP